MFLYWVLGILLVSAVVPSICQSGDGNWGSGELSQAPSGTLLSEPKDGPEESKTATVDDPEHCPMRFYTCPVSARRLRAMREELSYLQSIQQGNQAVLAHLVQYISAEMGEQSYQDVVQENMAGIKEDHLSCEGVIQKVEEDMKTQLEGGILEILAGTHKIKEESLAFESMLSTVLNMAQKLESSIQSLHASFTKQLKKSHPKQRHFFL
ncbi:hypothetical protein GN956_G15839 [Arapaima gigas]